MNSCPHLSRAAYVGGDLFGQLNAQAKFILLAPSYVQVDATGQLVKLPEIFKWYETDFSLSGAGKTGVMYMNQFCKESRLLIWYSVKYYPYNWGLNDQK